MRCLMSVSKRTRNKYVKMGLLWSHLGDDMWPGLPCVIDHRERPWQKAGEDHISVWILERRAYSGAIVEPGTMCVTFSNPEDLALLVYLAHSLVDFINPSILLSLHTGLWSQEIRKASCLSNLFAITCSSLLKRKTKSIPFILAWETQSCLCDPSPSSLTSLSTKFRSLSVLS